MPKKEICHYCSRRRAEDDMLYVVSEDAYFCKVTNCWDEYTRDQMINEREKELKERNL